MLSMSCGSIRTSTSFRVWGTRETARVEASVGPKLFDCKCGQKHNVFLSKVQVKNAVLRGKMRLFRVFREGNFEGKSARLSPELFGNTEHITVNTLPF